MYNVEDNKQNTILASVNTGAFDAEDSMQELEELAETAGARVVVQVIQNMPAVNSATYLGAGKLAQIKETADRRTASEYRRADRPRCNRPHHADSGHFRTARTLQRRQIAG